MEVKPPNDKPMRWGALNAQVLEQPEEVVLIAVRPRRALGQAVPAYVIQDDPILPGERPDLTVPHPVIEAAAVKEHERFALPHRLVIQEAALNRREARSRTLGYRPSMAGR